MNMNQAALAAAISQGATSGVGGPGTPGQHVRLQQALALQAAQGGQGLNLGLGGSPHNPGSPSSAVGNNVMGSTAHMAYERIDSLSDEKRAEVFEKVGQGGHVALSRDTVLTSTSGIHRIQVSGNLT
jgi:hypothetical protein